MTKEGFAPYPGLFNCSLSGFDRQVMFPAGTAEIKVGLTGWCQECGNRCGEVTVTYVNNHGSHSEDILLGEASPSSEI